MKSLHPKTTSLSSKILTPQKKPSEPIIPLKLANKSLNQSQITSSSQSKKKQNPPKDTPSLNPPTSDFLVQNSAEISINQPIQITNNKSSSNVGIRPKTAVKSSVSQNILKESPPKKSVRPTTANSSLSKKPISPMTVSLHSAKLNKQTQPQNIIIKPLSASELLIDSKNKQIKSSFKLTKPSSTQSSTVSMIQKQNEDMLKNLISVKSSIPKQINPKISQSTSSQKKNMSSQASFTQNQIQNELIQEEEEEKEGFDFFKKDQDCHIEEIEVKSVFQSENNEKIFQVLEQLESSALKLPPPFFDALNFNIALQVANFLTVKDLIKLATLSRQSRSFVAMAVKKINYTMNIEQYSQNKYKQEYSAVDRIQKMKKDFNSLLKKKDFEKEFLNFLRKSSKSQNLILEILSAGIIYSDNIPNQSIDVISNIKAKGLLKCFSGINLPFIPPTRPKNINLSPYYPSKNTSNEQFIKVIHQYVEFRKTNKTSIIDQQQATKQTVLYRISQKFMDNKLKLYAEYQKPLQKLKNSSNIFDYINKNTLQNVIKFLTLKEVLSLLQSGQKMREIVKQVVQNQLTYLENQREEKLLSLGFQIQFGNGILYAKQFEQFVKEEKSYISSERFSFAPLCEQLKAICYAVTSKTQEEIDTQFQVNPIIMYNIKFNYLVPHPKRLQLINSFLENYSTLKEFKQKKLNSSNIPSIDERGSILLYQAMKGLQKLSQFRQNWLSFEEANLMYSQAISPLDNIIFNYQRLLEKNEDELFMLPKLQSQKVSSVFEGADLIFPN